jgi:undecaprenyl-diphosphatase
MQVISYLDTIDKQLFLFLNGIHCSFMDAVMWQISQNKFIGLPLYILIIWYIIKERKWKAAIVTILFLALMIVISDQLSGIIKNAVLRFRPSHNPEFSNIIHILRDYKGGNYGFVSSHAANSFATALFVTLFFKKRWVGITIFLWAIILSYSRIYLGVHYPFDILGGAIVGIFSGLLVFYAERWIYNKYLRSKK